MKTLTKRILIIIGILILVGIGYFLLNKPYKSQTENIGLGEPDNGDLYMNPSICLEDNYNCGDFETQLEAQEIFDLCGGNRGEDIHRLDADGNGVACEGLS